MTNQVIDIVTNALTTIMVRIGWIGEGTGPSNTEKISPNGKIPSQATNAILWRGGGRLVSETGKMNQPSIPVNTRIAVSP